MAMERPRPVPPPVIRIERPFSRSGWNTRHHLRRIWNSRERLADGWIVTADASSEREIGERPGVCGKHLCAETTLVTGQAPRSQESGGRATWHTRPHKVDYWETHR